MVSLRRWRLSATSCRFFTSLFRNPAASWLALSACCGSTALAGWAGPRCAGEICVVQRFRVLAPVPSSNTPQLSRVHRKQVDVRKDASSSNVVQSSDRHFSRPSGASRPAVRVAVHRSAASLALFLELLYRARSPRPTSKLEAHNLLDQYITCPVKDLKDPNFSLMNSHLERVSKQGIFLYGGESPCFWSMLASQVMSAGFP